MSTNPAYEQVTLKKTIAVQENNAYSTVDTESPHYEEIHPQTTTLSYKCALTSNLMCSIELQPCSNAKLGVLKLCN